MATIKFNSGTLTGSLKKIKKTHKKNMQRAGHAMALQVRTKLRRAIKNKYGIKYSLAKIKIYKNSNGVALVRFSGKVKLDWHKGSLKGLAKRSTHNPRPFVVAFPKFGGLKNTKRIFNRIDKRRLPIENTTSDYDLNIADLYKRGNYASVAVKIFGREYDRLNKLSK